MFIRKMIYIKYADSFWIKTFRCFQQNEGIDSLLIFFLYVVVPVSFAYYMLSYFLFELYLNVFAEITKFGDRQFYLEFWNITSYGEYGRSWNKITHEFLSCHIFKPCKAWLGYSNFRSAIITTVISSILHEYFMWCLIKELNIYMVSLMGLYSVLSIAMYPVKGSKFGEYFMSACQIIGMAINFIPYIANTLDISIISL